MDSKFRSVPAVTVMSAHAEPPVAMLPVANISPNVLQRFSYQPSEAVSAGRPSDTSVVEDNMLSITLGDAQAGMSRETNEASQMPSPPACNPNLTEKPVVHHRKL